jgi:cation diffusion facilitator family transporter
LRTQELYRRTRRAIWVGIVVSLLLGTAKFAGGWFGHSIALLSDAVHSLGDVLVGAAVLGALVWAQRPADQEHPYGHTRAEAAAGSSVALLLILSALGIVWEAATTLGKGYEEPHFFALVIACASLATKEGVYNYSRQVARRTGSSALDAAAWDHRMDAFGSLAVILAIGLTKWGGPAFHAADHVGALAVAVTMLWTGSGLFWKSLNELLDRQAEPDLLDTLRREARAVAGVLGVEKLLVRKTGLEYLVDIHVEVDPAISVRDGHAIGHAVKDRLLQGMVPVKDVLVHIEPAPDKKSSEE